jgi:hypothetical protein
MGSMYYRGIDPSAKGYTELRYWHRWHEKIEAAWKKAAGLSED